MTTAGARVVISLLVVSAFVAGCSNPEREKVEHLKKGDQYVADKKDEFAVIEYASAVKIDPKFGDAYWKLAQASERVGNLRGAFAAYIRAADALPHRRDVQLRAMEVSLVARGFEDVKSRAASLIARDPKDLDARVMLANALLSLGDVSGASREIEQALALKSNDSKALLTLADVRTRQVKLQEAENAYRQAIAADPESPGVHLAYAGYLLQMGRSDDGEAALKNILERAPRHPQANQMLADLYLSTRRVKEAEQPLKVVASASSLPRPKFRLSEYYVGSGRVTDATAVLTSLAQNPETSVEAERRLAELEYLQDRVVDANRRLDALLARAPKDAPALALKAQWLATENKLDEALVKAQAAATADPQSDVAFAALGVVRERRGEIGDAMKAYTEELRLNPGSANAQVALSRLNLATGEKASALEFALQARRLAPSNAVARVALARSLMANGDLGRAQTEIDALVQAAPDAALVHTLRGVLLSQKNELTGARRAFERSLELEPGGAEAIGGLTNLDIRAKTPGLAVNRIEAEMARRPNDVRLMAFAAQAYNAAGDARQAEEVLRRAVAVDPRFTPGYMMLAGMYLNQKRIDAARAEFESIAKQQPASPGPSTMVGILLEVQGRGDAAQKWYEDLLRRLDDAPVAGNNLAYIYAEQGKNLDMALQLATTAKQKMPDSPDVDDTIGWVYYKKDLASLAVQPLEASLARRPNNPEVTTHLGLAYAKLGNRPKARELLNRARQMRAGVGGAEVDQALAALSQ